MREPGHSRTPPARHNASLRGALALGLAALLAGATPSAAHAAATNASFRVVVELDTDGRGIGTCERSAEKDGSVLVVCTLETPTPQSTAGKSARDELPFLLRLQRGGGQVGSVDGLMPPGTVTSWNVLAFGGREYLEIMVGW